MIEAWLFVILLSFGDERPIKVFVDTSRTFNSETACKQHTVQHENRLEKTLGNNADNKVTVTCAQVSEHIYYSVATY